MVNKYKLEKWKKTQWRNTQREQIITIERLVKRDSKGRFISVILEVKEKTYGSGVYKVGLSKEGKIVTRQKIAGKETPEWKRNKQEFIKSSNIFRCSLALNDIPYKGEEYYGFRIIAFSRRKELLFKVYPKKMYDKLIQFIEKCLKYRSDDFWFSHYLNYMGKIPPEVSNGSFRDNGKYELLWTKRKTGSIMRQETGLIGEL